MAKRGLHRGRSCCRAHRAACSLQPRAVLLPLLSSSPAPPGLSRRPSTPPAPPAPAADTTARGFKHRPPARNFQRVPAHVDLSRHARTKHSTSHPTPSRHLQRLRLRLQILEPSLRRRQLLASAAQLRLKARARAVGGPTRESMSRVGCFMHDDAPRATRAQGVRPAAAVSATVAM